MVEFKYKQSYSLVRKADNFSLSITKATLNIIQKMLNNARITKVILTIFFYISLLIPFVWFYMYDELNDFIRGRTTIASRFEESSKIEFPTLTFCTSNVFKPSVMQKLGFITNHQLF